MPSAQYKDVELEHSRIIPYRIMIDNKIYEYHWNDSENNEIVSKIHYVLFLIDLFTGLFFTSILCVGGSIAKKS